MPLTTRSKLTKGAIEVPTPPWLLPKHLAHIELGQYFRVPDSWGTDYPVMKDLDWENPGDQFKLIITKKGRFIERVMDDMGNTFDVREEYMER